MKGFPAESIDMVMFSPPYYGLRNYGAATETVWGGEANCSHEWIEDRMTLVHENRNFLKGTQEDVYGNKPTTYIKKYDDRKADFCVKCGAWKGQLGLEPSWQMYVAHMGEVCRELKRVLKKTGSMYIVLGDTYAGSHCGKGDKRLKPNKQKAQFLYEKPSPQANITDYQPKCLIGIPWRVAFALIDDGWVLRERIVWHKGNAMPGSQKDRLTQTCELIFHFVKNTGKALLWRNELTGEWRSEKPKQVYYHVETHELKDECPPKEERYVVDDFGSRHLVWKPLWRGFDYYYELDAIREPHKSVKEMQRYYEEPKLKKAKRFRRRESLFQVVPVEAPHRSSKDVIGRYESRLKTREAEEAFFGHPQTNHYQMEDSPKGKNRGDAFQTKKEPYIGNNPHRMRLQKEQFLALDPSRPMDLSHPKGKNPGDVISERVKANLEHFIPKGSGGHYAYGGIDSEEGRHEHPSGKNPGDVVPTKHDLAVNRVGNFSYADPLHVKAYNIKGKNPGDYWNICTKPFKGAHFAVYPEEICIKPLLSSCPSNGIVLDPMCGSGTTLAVARKLGRRYIGIEINPNYVNIAKQRLLRITTLNPLIS
jgi:DNA modification methylase